MSHLVSRITYFSVRHWIATVVVLLLLTVAAGFFAATHFSMTTDTGALISSKVAWRQREITINNAFPQLGDSMLIVLDAETPELAERSADRLTAKLMADHQHFTRVVQPDGGPFFSREGLLFRTPEALRKQLDSLIAARPLLAALAADPTLRGVARTISGLIANSAGAQPGGTTGVADASGQLAASASGLADTLDRVAQGRKAYFSWQELLGGDVPPTRRLITVQPVLNHGALMPGEAASEAIRSAENELGLNPANGVTVRLTGEVPLADEEFATLSSNVDVVGMVMLVAMLVMLWIATHSTRIVAGIVITTLAGLVVTTALGLLTVGTFNLISVAFIPLFVGLGVDFGIQIAVRFAAERWYGKNTPDALRHAADRLAAPLLLAAAAIFLGFGAFLPTAYVGIAQLGLVAGVGMIVAFLFSVTLLPALLMCLRPGIPPREVGFAGAEPLDRFLVHRRRFVVAGFVVAIIASIALLPLLRFDFNPMHLRNPNAPAMRTLTDLTRDPDRTPNTINVLADNPQQAAALAKKLAALPEVRAAVTLQDFIPQDQPAKLAMIESAARQLAPVLHPNPTPAPSDAEVVEALKQGAARLRSATDLPPAVTAPAGKLADAFASLAAASPADRQKAGKVVSQPLDTMLGQLRLAMQAKPVTADSLPDSLRRDWEAPNGKSRIQVMPSGKSNDNRTLRRFREAVASVTPDISGLPVATQAAASTVANAFIQAGIIALLLISGLLYLVLRSVREVAFTLAPVVLSGFLTLATCVVIGQPINFANIIAFPLLFGVGVAFHIYFVMAWRAGATNLLQSSLARAVLFSALATGTAFGSLWLSHHPGTASMGKLLMISLAWTLVCALIFEPALLGPPPPPQERHGVSPEDPTE